MAVREATMTLQIGMRENKQNTPAAFTLVELILVMALLATIMALAAPSFSPRPNTPAMKPSPKVCR